MDLVTVLHRFPYIIVPRVGTEVDRPFTLHCLKLDHF